MKHLWLLAVLIPLAQAEHVIVRPTEIHGVLVNPGQGNPSLQTIKGRAAVPGSPMFRSRSPRAARSGGGETRFSRDYDRILPLALGHARAREGKGPLGDSRHRAPTGAVAWPDAGNPPDALRSAASTARVVSQFRSAARQCRLRGDLGAGF